ncbi:uncharacterized protein LOC128887597 isoform X1 [Hylaeus anthracinus]|uniref:uncharacterized protein LOC128887597 isoform X1 n=2 Tax=Hylaeus anthracinus TaxID=313031 RepID=UPI0023B8B7B8|nr:uncharacterized protein LOC128887597 isoform X1 [Hylaeus anthracinus]
MNDTETNDRPKWLLELENRKRKPRLAHEAGAGAPCVICKATCPGLDLHFWRKTCKNCKCSKDDHDVNDEDFPQFDLLFGSSRKYKKKPTLLHIHNEKEYAEEAFEWIPPDTTKELAIDYMKAFPIEKLPIKGSTGAALRRQLLQKQLPLHDIDHKVCDKLSEQEKKEFEKYLDSIKKYVGQGTVTKILGARPFERSLMTPANATDMQRFSPQHKATVQSSMVQLRTPSSFTLKNSYKKDFHEMLNKHDTSANLEALTDINNTDKIAVLEKYNINSNNSTIVKSEPVKTGLYNKGINSINYSRADDNRQDFINKDIPSTEHLKFSNSLSIANVDSEVTLFPNPSEYCKEAYRDALKNPSSPLLHSKPVNNDTSIAESILADAFLPPSTVHANDIIGSTLDSKGLMFIREKLTNKYSNQENQLSHNVPSFAKNLDSVDLLLKNNNSGLQNVSIDKGTDKTTITATMKNPSGISTLSEDRIKKIERNTVEPKLIKAEKEVIKPNSQVVQSIPLDSTLIVTTNEKDKVQQNTSLIPSKLNGRSCLLPQTSLEVSNAGNHQEKLSNLTAPSTIIYSEKLQNQIFPYEIVGGASHVQNLPHIEQLNGGMEELTMDAIKPQKCHKCEEVIRVGDVAVITEKAKHAMWHPGCFVCSICNELLADLVYFYYKNKLYCGRDLSTFLGIPRCFACDELIFVREYTVAEGHNYHIKHFCCWDCDIPLAGKKYITENDRPLCLPCYQKSYAKTCNACEKVIAADQQGVPVKDLHFHATESCFCCFICKRNLLNGRIAVKEKKIFCSKECISKFQHMQI